MQARAICLLLVGARCSTLRVLETTRDNVADGGRAGQRREHKYPATGLAIMIGEHMKVLKGPTTMLYPCPIALVTCADGSGRDDIITLAWVGVADSTPPIIAAGIRPTRYSAGLINKSREFVVNIPTVALLEKVDYCGTVSGFDIKKFETTGLTREHASKVKAPMIKECPVNLECKLKRTVLLGSHRLYLGEVLETHIEEGIIDSKGGIDYEKAQPFVYNTREYWSMGKKIGLHGFSKGMLRQS